MAMPVPKVEVNQMRCLVTGGAGFIGSHLCERLLSEGYEVVCLDNFDPYYDPAIKRMNIKHSMDSERFRLIEGDIRDKELLKMLIQDEGVDYVFHNAAQAGVRASIENPEKTNDVNVNGTLNILTVSKDSSVKKIINASSSSVYGKVRYLPLDDNHPKAPLSPYGVSKLAAEEYCRVFYEVYGLRVTTLRPFTVYGPRMRPDLAVSIFTRRALSNEPIEIFGDGEQSRDFTYIFDVVEAYIKAVNKGDGRAYNIGAGKRYSINELAAKIIKVTGSRSKIVRTEKKKGEAAHTQADPNKAKAELGWEPGITLEQGLKKFVEWFKSESAQSQRV